MRTSTVASLSMRVAPLPRPSSLPSARNSGSCGLAAKRCCASRGATVPVSRLWQVRQVRPLPSKVSRSNRRRPFSRSSKPNSGLRNATSAGSPEASSACCSCSSRACCACASCSSGVGTGSVVGFAAGATRSASSSPPPPPQPINASAAASAPTRQTKFNERMCVTPARKAKRRTVPSGCSRVLNVRDNVGKGIHSASAGASAAGRTPVPCRSSATAPRRGRGPTTAKAALRTIRPRPPRGPRTSCSCCEDTGAGSFARES